MEIKVEAKVFPERIEIEELFKDTHFNSNIIHQKMKQVINLREKAVIDALISLGWTPPAESKKLVEALENIANPFKAMQTEAQESGYELNVEWALKLSECDVYLKELARGALAEFRGATSDN